MVGVYFFSKQFAKGIQFKQSHNKPMAIILDHTSPSVMHFGDLLFFLDIVWLANANNLPVFLVGSNHLKGFFSLFKVKHLTHLSQAPSGIVLTKSDSYLFFKDLDHTLIGFNFWKVEGAGPISPLLKQHFLQFCKDVFPNLIFKMPDKPFTCFFKELALENRHSKHCDKWVVVNSFVKSQRIAAFFRQRAFTHYVKSLYDCRDHQFVCIGSKADALVNVHYPIDKDLRGQRSIDDLLHLFINNKIERVITFDTFIAHVAILFNVPTDVFIKSKFRTAVTKQRFVPFCEYKQASKATVSFY